MRLNNGKPPRCYLQPLRKVSFPNLLHKYISIVFMQESSAIGQLTVNSITFGTVIITYSG